MEEKYLPLGSVVMLKEGKKEIMITGYLTIPKDNPNVMYDYSAVLYPEGEIDSDQVLAFNIADIDKIIFRGYQTDAEKEYVAKLDALRDKYFQERKK